MANLRGNTLELPVTKVVIRESLVPKDPNLKPEPSSIAFVGTCGFTVVVSRKAIAMALKVIGNSKDNNNLTNQEEST